MHLHPSACNVALLFKNGNVQKQFENREKKKKILQVYGGEARISTLRKLFPLMEDKKSLATANERSRVEGKASLLAAVDYYVSMQSDIFISASPGNMHNAMVSTQLNYYEF